MTKKQLEMVQLHLAQGMVLSAISVIRSSGIDLKAAAEDQDNQEILKALKNSPYISGMCAGAAFGYYAGENDVLHSLSHVMQKFYRCEMAADNAAKTLASSFYKG